MFTSPFYTCSGYRDATISRESMPLFTYNHALSFFFNLVQHMKLQVSLFGYLSTIEKK